MVRSISAEDYRYVVALVGNLVRYLPINSIDQEDLVQAGMIGLMEAIASYDSERNCSLKTYAAYRIKGAVIDEIRKQSFLPRRKYRTETTKFYEIGDLKELIPSDDEICKCDLRIDIESALRKLPEKERRVIILYHFIGETMKNIGSAMGLTESRVCQLNSTGLSRLNGMGLQL